MFSKISKAKDLIGSNAKSLTGELVELSSVATDIAKGAVDGISDSVVEAYKTSEKAVGDAYVASSKALGNTSDTIINKSSMAYSASRKAVGDTGDMISSKGNEAITVCGDYTTKAVGKLDESITSAKETISGEVNYLRALANNTVSKGVDEAGVTVDVILNSTKSLSIGALAMATGVGITYASSLVICAPIAVPVTIFGSLLCLTELSVMTGASILDDIDSGDKKRLVKKNERALESLRTYGAIPETATIKTKYLDASLNSKTRTISGEILTGRHFGRTLESLTVNELVDVKHNMDCEDSRLIMEQYINIRWLEAKKGK